MPATPKEIREARAYLYNKGYTSSLISPMHFANAAKDSGKSFAATLKSLVDILKGGQGRGPAPIGQKLAGADK